MQPEQKVDLSFKVVGRSLLVDHGYALYSALSRIFPDFHEDTEVGLGLIRGRYVGEGLIEISPHSSLVFRLPHGNVRRYIGLAGKNFTILGAKLTVGVPVIKALRPSEALYSHLVTTRNCLDQGRFDREIRKQMQSLISCGAFSVGTRRTFKIHGKQVVGYSLQVTGLDPMSSIVLQGEGLGGRRKMGCGFFEPKSSNNEQF